ncbi:MAG TPA: DNA-3-methyladenine glycosylase 2 family protein, partial [Vicinamibacteria bacterium]|nr:DNA-3-methyladenine glycosylase 2 family protein [Vicinamibacteria bacterium]
MLLDATTLRRAARHVARNDAVMAPLVRRVGPCRFEIDRGGGPFASLVEAIMYQQLAGAAAVAIFRRFRERIGRRYARPVDIAALPDAELRKVGLSRQKIGYLRDLTARVQDGLALHRVHRMDDEGVVRTLTQVKGVGRWTAQMYLMFRLGRLDVLPVDDYGVRKAMQTAYRMRKLPKPERMERIAEPWRPYRSVACWYLWRSLDTKLL